MRLKDEMPDPVRKVYHIDSITVYVNSGFRPDTNRLHAYVTPEGYRIIDSAKFLRPSVFSNTLLMKPNSIYKEDDHNSSLSRLVSLGVFQFVKARFNPASSADSNSKLNLYYYLTPAQKKQLRFEVTALTRSDNTTGTELAINWRHRNLFRGGELFSIRLYSGIEGQSVGLDSATHKNIKSLTRRAGVNIALTIPKIVSPFNLNTSGKLCPRRRSRQTMTPMITPHYMTSLRRVSALATSSRIDLPPRTGLRYSVSAMSGLPILRTASSTPSISTKTCTIPSSRS